MLGEYGAGKKGGQGRGRGETERGGGEAERGAYLHSATTGCALRIPALGMRGQDEVCGGGAAEADHFVTGTD